MKYIEYKFPRGGVLRYVKNKVSKSTMFEIRFDGGTKQNTIPGLAHFCEHMVFGGTDKLSEEEVNEKLNSEYIRFESMWQNLKNKYQCPIIQNNFDYLSYRILGNKDATDYRGKTNFITKLNLKFYDYAENNANFYILDIN